MQGADHCGLIQETIRDGGLRLEPWSPEALEPWSPGALPQP